MWGKRFALSWTATTGPSAAPIAHVSVIVIPMNPLMQSRAVEIYLANTGAKALSGSPTFAAAAVGDGHQKPG
jgi:hypothetical protein